MSAADEIKKLKELLDANALTIDEYEEQKKVILNSQQKKVNFNIKNFDLNKKNKRIIYFIIGLLVLFPFRNNLFPSVNSSDLINLLEEDNLADRYSFNTFEYEPQYQGSDQLYGGLYKFTEKIEFDINGHNKGGQAFLCKTKSECDAIYEYMDDKRLLVGQLLFQSPDGKLVMQLSSSTPLSIAKKFEKVVDKIRNTKARSHNCTGKRCFLSEWKAFSGKDF